MFRSLLLSLLLASPLAAADATAYRCSGPTTGTIRVLEDNDGACRGFSIDGKEQYFTRIVSGTLLVSADRKTIVLVEDYLNGAVDGGAIVASIDRETITNPTVLQIWRDGKRVAMYDVARLVKDVKKVQESISHVRWVARMPKTIDARFSLITTTGREVTFDSKTGNLVDERDVPVPKY